MDTSSQRGSFDRNKQLGTLSSSSSSPTVVVENRGVVGDGGGRVGRTEGRKVVGQRGSVEPGKHRSGAGVTSVVVGVGRVPRDRHRGSREPREQSGRCVTITSLQRSSVEPGAHVNSVVGARVGARVFGGRVRRGGAVAGVVSTGRGGRVPRRGGCVAGSVYCGWVGAAVTGGRRPRVGTTGANEVVCVGRPRVGDGRLVVVSTVLIRFSSAHTCGPQPPRQISMSHFRNTCIRSGNLNALMLLCTTRVAPELPVCVVFCHSPNSFFLREHPFLSDSCSRAVVAAS